MQYKKTFWIKRNGCIEGLCGENEPKLGFSNVFLKFYLFLFFLSFLFFPMCIIGHLHLQGGLLGSVLRVGLWLPLSKTRVLSLGRNEVGF